VYWSQRVGAQRRPMTGSANQSSFFLAAPWIDEIAKAIDGQGREFDVDCETHLYIARRAGRGNQALCPVRFTTRSGTAIDISSRRLGPAGAGTLSPVSILQLVQSPM
jgi:hypothetical protein